MSYNEEMDKIVLDKLGGYSEEPAPDIFRSILSERERSAKSKLLNRILLIAVGAAALAALMYLLLRSDKADDQSSVLYPQNGFSASSADPSTNQFNSSASGSGRSILTNQDGNANLYNAPALSGNNSGHPAGASHLKTPAGKKHTTKPGAVTTLPLNAPAAPETQEAFTDSKLNVAFNYLIDSLGEITFYNQTIASEDVQYEWYFGDGSGSKEKDPVHKFKRNGYYHVCLTVTTANGSYDSHCDDISIDHLPNRKNLIGKVNAGNSVPDKGWVYLISFDSMSRVPYLVDSSKLDEMGYFAFNEIPTGFYLVRATLEQKSIHFREYMPTYYGQTLVWNSAKRYNLSPVDKINSELLIVNLLSVKGNNNGDNTIDGQTNTSDDLLDDNIVILYDQDGKPIGYAHLGPDGRFSFGDLPPGNYQVYNPKTGSYTNYTTGSSTAGSGTPPPPAGGTGGGTQSGTPPPPPPPQLTIWPNPCSEGCSVLNIKIANEELSAYTITISNMHNPNFKFTQNGDKHPKSMIEIQIDVSNYAPGMYVVTVQKSNGNTMTANFQRY